MSFVRGLAEATVIACLATSSLHFAVAQSTNEFLLPGGSEPKEKEDPFQPVKVTLYYNHSWELTTQEKSAFRRETSLDFINMIFSGVYKDYSKENKLIGDGFYDDGNRKGLQSEYFEDGSLRSTIEFADKGFIIWELTNDNKEVEVTHGTGKFEMSYYSFEESNHNLKLHEGILKGEFINGKRTGAWTYRDSDGKITDDEIYLNGFFSKRIVFTPTGMVDHHDVKSVFISIGALVAEAFNFEATTFTQLNQYFEINPPAYPAEFERNVTFPGGMKKLLLLIALNLQIEIDDPVLVKMTIDEHGHLEKIKGPLIVGRQALEKEVTRVLQPFQLKFLPAIKTGKPHESTLLLPVASSQEWVDFIKTGSLDDVYSYVAELNQN